MKHLFFAIILMVSCASQKSEAPEPSPKTEYASIYYGSICCGAPSSDMVLEFTKTYFASKKLTLPKIYKQSGLGREGEYRLYISLDTLKPKYKEDFFAQLQKTIEKQNSKRNPNADGIVNFAEKVAQNILEQEVKIKRTGIKKLEELKISK